jgi:hypothetical protein
LDQLPQIAKVILKTLLEKKRNQYSRFFEFAAKARLSILSTIMLWHHIASFINPERASRQHKEKPCPCDERSQDRL